MPRLAMRHILFAVPLVLAGCSGISADWVKPGASETQVKIDNAACRAGAEEAFGQGANISHDIRVSRPRTASDVGRRSNEIRNYETERNYEVEFGACMAARGYKKGKAGR